MSENVGKRDAEAVPSQPGDAADGAAATQAADEASAQVVPKPTPPADEADPVGDVADPTPDVAPPAQRGSATNGPLPAQPSPEGAAAAGDADRPTVIGSTSPTNGPADQVQPGETPQSVTEGAAEQSPDTAAMAEAPTAPSPVTNPLPDHPEPPTAQAADDLADTSSDLDTVALTTAAADPDTADPEPASVVGHPDHTRLAEATVADDAADQAAAYDTVPVPAGDSGQDTVAMTAGAADPSDTSADQDTKALVSEDDAAASAADEPSSPAPSPTESSDADQSGGAEHPAADQSGGGPADATAADRHDAVADDGSPAASDAAPQAAPHPASDDTTVGDSDAGADDPQATEVITGDATEVISPAADDAAAGDGTTTVIAAADDNETVPLPDASASSDAAPADDAQATQPMAADAGDTVPLPAGDADLDTVPLDAQTTAAALANQETEVLPRGGDAAADADRRSALAGLAKSSDAPEESPTRPMPGQPAEAQETLPMPSDRDGSATASTVQQDIVHDGVPKPAELHEPASNRLWLIGGATALLLTGVVYVGTAAAVANRIPASATVGGVPVAGQNKDQLQEKLQQKSAELAQQPVTLSAGDASAEVIPQEAGLVADPQATVDQFEKFSLNPIVIWNKLTGRGDYQFITAVDDAKLQTAVDQAAGEINRNPVEPEVTFEGATVKKVDAADGYVLDVPGTKEALRTQWPAASTIDVPREVNAPATSQDALDLVMNDFVNPVVSDGITIKTTATSGSKEVLLEPAAFTPAISIVAEEGVMSPKIDGEKLTEIAIEKNEELVVEPKDASVEMSGGKPTVVPGVKGETLDPESLTQQFISAATTPERIAQVNVTEADPEITTAKLESLLVPQSMYKFESKMPVNANRTHNIKLAAGTINGTLLMPGETFSMNETLGRRTSAKGYRAAGVIMGGKMAKDVGGGISQLATTLFNTMFFSGLDEVEHKPHSFYISRYPEGREATVNYPTVDLKFTNDTPKAVYIQTGVTGQTVWAQFWGEKQYSEITAAKGNRRNIRQPKVIEDNSTTCVKQSPAAGFDVTVSRIFKNGGAEVKRESFKHRYIPKDHIKCTAGQKPPAAPAPAPPGGGAPAGAVTPPAVPPPGEN